MTALVQWVERRTGTAYPKTVLYVPLVALAAVVAALLEACPW